MLKQLQIFAIFAVFGFISNRIKVLMRFFQQEEYDNKRFILYFTKNPNLIDKKLSLTLIMLLLLTLICNHAIIHFSLFTIILIIFACLQQSYFKHSKKPLVITPRVKRLFIVTTLLAVIVLNIVILHKITDPRLIYIITLILVQGIPLLMVSANILLLPLEKIIQYKYLREAKAKLARCNPIIIGITGSYGKTSTKHILAHILSSIAPTLATPGSINTTMGITRIIREHLTPEHKFFIVEMGAYGKGSIAKLCKLTPPTHGVITAIGNAHFERFKTIENVAQAKFELAEAIKQKQSGFIIINSDAIEQKFIDQYCNNDNTITVKTSTNSNAATYTITEAKQTLSGVNFQIGFNASRYSVTTNLYGLHHIGNMGVCFALAHNLKISPETIIAALNHTPQIQHRLEVIKEKTKPIIIDDAYNANPAGFTAALDLLKTFKANGHRTIIVTPGIVELGSLHNEKHFELGEKTAQAVDYALIIIPQRIKAFIAGFNSKASNNQTLLTFNTFNEARVWLHNNATDLDVILYENDLPDLYESVVKL